jgi:hypothetical protein
LISLILSFIVTTGIASQYDAGVMSNVIHTRQTARVSQALPTNLPDVDGYIAVEECDRVGDIVDLRPSHQEEWESFLIADCSGHQSTSNWMQRNNIIAEVDHQTAVRWETVGYGIEIEIREPIYTTHKHPME